MEKGVNGQWCFKVSHRPARSCCKRDATQKLTPFDWRGELTTLTHPHAGRRNHLLLLGEVSWMIDEAIGDVIGPVPGPPQVSPPAFRLWEAPACFTFNRGFLEVKRSVMAWQPRPRCQRFIATSPRRSRRVFPSGGSAPSTITQPCEKVVSRATTSFSLISVIFQPFCEPNSAQLSARCQD